MNIVRATGADSARILEAVELFDEAPTQAYLDRFFEAENHHFLLAVDEQGVVLGFVSGVETTHPDKGTEMFLYELSVGEPYRRRGIGKALVKELAALALERGCYGMWVGTEPDNEAALATYAAAGAASPEPCVTLTWTFAAPTINS